MKTYRLLLACGFAMALLSGCSDFLDKEPLVEMNAEAYYSTEDELNTAALGVYSVLQHESYELGHYLIIGDLCSDDADLGTERSEAYSWFGATAQACQDFSLLANNWLITAFWSQGWSLVNAACQLIDNADGSEIENAQTYVGEAQFLRAFTYMNLVMQYGAMPIVDHVLSYDEYYNPRATLEENWEFIESDLEKAIDNLPESWDSSNEGRATKGAAMSFLARAYIYQEKWQDAYNMISDIVDAGYYSLEPNFEDIFAMDHENGCECIFAIQHSISGTGWSDSNEGNLLCFYEHDAGILESDLTDATLVALFQEDETAYEKWQVGWSMHCPTWDLINEFEDGDPRLAATVIAPYEYYDGHYHYNLSSRNHYQSKKYYVPYDDRSTSDQSDLPKNLIALRYADILLYMAEACNELGNSSEALTYLNQVRSRVGMADVTTTAQSDLRDAIYHERRVELAMEYNRFYDLARQGRVGEVMQAYYQNYKDDDGTVDLYGNLATDSSQGTIKGKNFVIGKNEIFPIPSTAIDASGGTMTQNPGY